MWMADTHVCRSAWSISPKIAISICIRHAEHVSHSQGNPANGRVINDRPDHGSQILVMALESRLKKCACNAFYAQLVLVTLALPRVPMPPVNAIKSQLIRTKSAFHFPRNQ